MTFRITPSGSVCTHCDTETGRNWRDRAQHMCPRAFTPAPRPTCMTCDKPLTQRDGETVGDWRRRTHCNRSCASANRNRERGAA